MRVIAGKAKRTQLRTLPGMNTRPTTDRIKETLFNMLQPYIYDINFLDMFAGSGGIGIEALSRGAKQAFFVESNRKAAEIIKSNLDVTHLSEKAKVLNMTALSAVKHFSDYNNSFDERLSDTESFNKFLFDMVFMDPPYDCGLEMEILREPDFYNILADDAMIIIEASLDTCLDFNEISGFSLTKEKIYKTNKHIFLEKNK